MSFGAIIVDFDQFSGFLANFQFQFLANSADYCGFWPIFGDFWRLLWILTNFSEFVKPISGDFNQFREILTNFWWFRAIAVEYNQILGDFNQFSTHF